MAWIDIAARLRSGARMSVCSASSVAWSNARVSCTRVIRFPNSSASADRTLGARTALASEEKYSSDGIDTLHVAKFSRDNSSGRSSVSWSSDSLFRSHCQRNFKTEKFLMLQRAAARRFSSSVKISHKRRGPNAGDAAFSREKRSAEPGFLKELSDLCTLQWSADISLE